LRGRLGIWVSGDAHTGQGVFLRPLPDGAQNPVALGGMIGSVIVLLAAAYWHNRKPEAMRSALLAGAMTLPGFYALRFFLAGAVMTVPNPGGTGGPGSELLGTCDGLAISWSVCPGGDLLVLAEPSAVELSAGCSSGGGGRLLGWRYWFFLQVGNNALFDRLLQP